MGEIDTIKLLLRISDSVGRSWNITRGVTLVIL